jgi:hypothetical protein
MSRIRAAFGAGSVALAIAGGLIAATASGGQTKETSFDQACAHAAWPMIPAQCLVGAGGQNVRYAVAGEATGTAMAERFAVAFRPEHGKPAVLNR